MELSGTYDSIFMSCPLHGGFNDSSLEEKWNMFNKRSPQMFTQGSMVRWCWSHTIGWKDETSMQTFYTATTFLKLLFYKGTNVCVVCWVFWLALLFWQKYRTFLLPNVFDCCEMCTSAKKVNWTTSLVRDVFCRKSVWSLPHCEIIYLNWKKSVSCIMFAVIFSFVVGHHWSYTWLSNVSWLFFLEIFHAITISEKNSLSDKSGVCLKKGAGTCIVGPITLRATTQVCVILVSDLG